METSKAKRHLLTPCHSEIRRYEGGFEWIFYGFRGEKEHAFVLRFERWWLSYLSRDIRKILKEEWEEMKRLADLCGFKENTNED